MSARTPGWRVVAAAVALAGCGVTGTNLGGLNTDAGNDATVIIEDDNDGGGEPLPDAAILARHDAGAVVHTEAGIDAGPAGDADAALADASPDARATVGPPQSGPFLDGSCPYDAAYSPDGDALAADAFAPDARVPDFHRPAALCCPVTRAPQATGPAPEGCSPDAATALTPCFVDSDCNKGTNGRCSIFPVPPGVDGCNSECTYDQCFSDVDCPGHVPCDCRSWGDGTNSCRTGSRCSVDSDCGQGGFCTPDLTGDQNTVNPYYCHKPGDVCFNNRDCPQGGYGARCRFDTNSDKWACVYNPPPP